MNKTVKNILILVGIGIIIYFLFKLDVFRNKTKIDDSSLIVNSTKGILEFISVEYYGEAIASYDLVAEDNYVEYRDEIKVLYDAIKLELQSYDDQRRNKKGKIARMNLFKSENVSLRDDSKYYQILDVTNTNKEWNALDYIRKTSWTKFVDKYNKFFNEKKLKDKIAYVGRGWVQAGFNFQSLNKDNVNVIDSLKTVTISGVEPEIMATIINPWLIPNEVKGYEIIYSSGRNVDFTQISQTKKSCLNRLLNDALIKGEILLKAKKSAENFFPDFFSVLLGKEIETVKFIISDNDLWYKSVAYDNMLDLGEINKIENYYKGIDQKDVKDEFKDSILPKIRKLEKSKDVKDRVIIIN